MNSISARLIERSAGPESREEVAGEFKAPRLPNFVFGGEVITLGNGQNRNVLFAGSSLEHGDKVSPGLDGNKAMRPRVLASRARLSSKALFARIDIL